MKPLFPPLLFGGNTRNRICMLVSISVTYLFIFVCLNFITFLRPYESEQMSCLFFVSFFLFFVYIE